MGNKLEKHQTPGERFNRLERADSGFKNTRSQSFVGKSKGNEAGPNVGSLQELFLQKTRPTPATNDRFSSLPRKPQISNEDSQKNTYSIERLRRKNDKVEVKEIDQAVAFSRHFTESFFQNALNPPIDHSALFPQSMNLHSRRKLPHMPERFRNMDSMNKQQTDDSAYQFRPEKQEFQLLVELFKGPVAFKEPETAVTSSSLFPNRYQKHNATVKQNQNIRQPESDKKKPANPYKSTRGKEMEKNGKISSSFLMDEGPEKETSPPRVKPSAQYRAPFQPQNTNFSPTKSNNNSAERNGEDSKSNQFSNEKQNRFQATGKSASTFKINEGHLFSFQKEFTTLNKLSSRRATTPSEVIVEETHDDREDESSVYIDRASNSKNQSLGQKLANKGRFPVKKDTRTFNNHKQSDSESQENEETSFKEDEFEETIDKFSQLKQKQLNELKAADRNNVHVINPVRSSFGEHMKNPRGVLTTDKPKQITLDLQLLTKKNDKDQKANTSFKPNKPDEKEHIPFPTNANKLDVGLGSNIRYKSPSTGGLQAPTDPRGGFLSNTGSKFLTSEQKPIASSLKSFLNKRDSVQMMETMAKDNIKPNKQMSISGLTNSNTQPKIMNKFPGANGLSADPNTKTYASLFNGKKAENKPLNSIPNPQDPHGFSKKEKIIEDSSKIVRKLREENVHRRDFSGFSQVKNSEHMQDFESESIEYKIFENILGDLQKQEGEPVRLGSNSKGNRISHSSKESSKHNIRVDIGNLSRQVQFNLESCFRKN